MLRLWEVRIGFGDFECAIWASVEGMRLRAWGYGSRLALARHAAPTATRWHVDRFLS